MSENEYRDAGDRDNDGESAGGGTEEFAHGSPALSRMSSRERRNYEREQRKRRQEAAKQRRRAIREEARRRRAGEPIEQPVEPDSGQLLGGEGAGAHEPDAATAATADSVSEPIDTGDFADVDDDDDGDGDAVGALDLSNLSRKQRREVRKRHREEMREAAKRERRRALAEERLGADEDAAHGDPSGGQGEPEQSGPDNEEPAPIGDEQTSAGEESEVAEPVSSETEAPSAPIVPQTPSEQEAADRIEVAERREEAALIAASEQEANASANRRVREVQQIQRVAEHGGTEGAEAGSRAWSPGAELDEDGHPIAPFADELRATEEHIRRRHQRDQELVEELDATEVRIGETRERTQQAIEDAQRRLEEIQSQAAEAEERASRAEQISEYKQAEAEREHRLLEMLEKINEAERRAREAEARARRAVADVARPFEPLKAPSPLPPDAPASIEDLKSRPFDPNAAEGEEQQQEVDPDVPVNINEGTFEQLRAVGLSVTQVGRLLAVRERTGGFASVDELDSIPGFPREFLDSVKDRLTA